jgi:hypothetical protein
MRYFIDCEFDGHAGRILSMALVQESGLSIYLRTAATANDPWVRENVAPLLDSHDADVFGTLHRFEFGERLDAFIGDDECPVIIADSPVDIGRFCEAISTDVNGGWRSTGFPQMAFEVHNVDCYPTDLPGAVQHNAYWDAMALRHKLAGG